MPPVDSPTVSERGPKGPRFFMPAMVPRAVVEQHLATLRARERCPRMHRPAIAGRAAVSRIVLVGQAPGDKEPKLGRPVAWTAGRTFFRWFHDALGWTEDEARDRIDLAAGCRCFPGGRPSGGDRVPAPEEIANGSAWLERAFERMRPALVLPVGQLAIGQFHGERPWVETIGQTFRITYRGHAADCIPLPHPSGASPWRRPAPGRTLLGQALGWVAEHEGVKP